MSEFSANDPYRYGRPDQPPPPPQQLARASRPTGKAVTRSSWELLRQDRDLLWLPVLSAITGLLAGAILFVPGFALGRAIGHTDKIGGYVGGVLAAFALSIISIYFQAALVIGANQRADGGDPTLRGVLRATWSMRGRIVAWAVVTTTVGLLIRALEQRLGAVGKIIGFLGGIAWAIASFFVVPVLVAENVGPIDAVKRSAHLIRETWGTSVRTTLRLALGFLLLYLPIFGVLAVGIAALSAGATVPGVIAVAIAVLGFIALTSIYAAITTYARALIYRFATGRPVPGVAPELLAGAFAPKRRRR